MNRNKKLAISFFIFLSVIIIAGIIFLCYSKNGSSQIADQLLTPRCPKLVVGVVSDIHAGNEKIKESEEGIPIYPSKYNEIFPSVLDKMKTEGVNLVISAGDNTSRGKAKFALDLKRIAEEKNMEIIWVKGNHDRVSENAMANFGLDSNYYYIDKCDWRFIALNSCDFSSMDTGGIGIDQMNWLKSVLETDKKIVIIIHHSIWKKENKEIINPIYDEFEKLISQSGNVRHVFSGHNHTENWDRIYNGVEYHAIPALSLAREPLDYKVFNLD
ncbi:MAG: metallophosphoesterase [Patescibacteria group bacterium]